jgi:hypothetical protein
VAIFFKDTRLGVMQESTTASTHKEQESQMGSTDKDADADIRQPSINTEPRTLDEMKLERAVVMRFLIFHSCLPLLELVIEKRTVV